MKFFQFSPQTAGTTGDKTVCEDWSARPIVFHKLQFELELWPEDDLIEAINQGYAGTCSLAEAIKAACMTGIEFDALDMIKYDQFWLWEEEHPGESIPEYLWFKFTGRAGIDDFGMTYIEDGFPLIVSERALKLLTSFKIGHCRVRDFDPSLLVAQS
ncbi:MAG: hypothetical protein WC815_21415 [Vicinamibacterales bacterium]|jgi:hypothetical protein